MVRSTSRRQYLAAAGTSSVALIAGCVGNGNGNGNGNGGGNDEITLSSANFVPESHPLATSGDLFRERTTELTDGQVQWDYFPGGQLGGPTDMITLAQNETADIVMIGVAYVEEDAPLSSVCSLPEGHTSSVQGSQAMHRLMNEELQAEEWDDLNLKYLKNTLLPPVQLITNTEVHTLDDWEGLTVRVPGATEELIVEALGGATARMPASDAYSAMERGTLDAILFGLYGLEAYSFHEVAGHATTNTALGGSGVYWFINQDRFDELPGNVQDALVQASEETLVPGAQGMDDFDNGAAEQFSDTVNLYEVSQDNLDEWYAQFPPVFDEWASQFGGDRAREIIDTWQEYLTEVDA